MTVHRTPSAAPDIERLRRTRLRATERRILTRLDALYRDDRPGYRALVRILRRVLTHEARRGR
jgi:hypothetical protein